MKKIFILFMIINGVMFGQEGLKFSAQIRPRFEIDNKDFNSNTDANTFTVFRTRLGLSFNPVKNIGGFVQVQDSRYFGEEPTTTTNTKNLDLHQAYFVINDLFELPVDLKLGRMEMNYGSERFMGTGNWTNVGRSFDGGVLTFKGEKFKADLFAAREFEKFNKEDSLDQNVYGLFTELMLMEFCKIQPFLIWQRTQPTDLLNRATLGLYVKGNRGSFSHEIDFGYQLGTVTASNRKQDISAYTFSLGGAYNFEGELKPTVGAQFDYVSGDDNAADNDYNAYTSLYGTGHKFFGYMDYFVNFPNDTYGLGVMDIIGKAGISPIAKMNLMLNFHIFKANKEYTLLNGDTSKNFGNELDFVLNYKYNDNVTFEGGASYFSAGDIFKEKRGKDSSTWFYLMAVVNF